MKIQILITSEQYEELMIKRDVLLPRRTLIEAVANALGKIELNGDTVFLGCDVDIVIL
jgi:hypothetical protein